MRPSNLDPAPLAPELSHHHFVDEHRELIIAHVTARAAQPGCEVVSDHLAPATVLLPDEVKQVDGPGRWRDAVIQLLGGVLFSQARRARLILYTALITPYRNKCLPTHSSRARHVRRRITIQRVRECHAR